MARLAINKKVGCGEGMVTKLLTAEVVSRGRTWLG